MTTIKKNNETTIAAIATPPGFGGIGVIRLSGPKVLTIAQTLLNESPQPRMAHYVNFSNGAGQIIDNGLLIYFPGPHSFTGEDVLELQGHGGPVVLDLLLKRILELGAELARPGEFSERAFLHGKIDLTQAEAIADLINASSEKSAQAAIKSLKGKFSKLIHRLSDKITKIRLQIEASIDFPEEELSLEKHDFLAQSLEEVLSELGEIKKSAQMGTLLREGVNIVIVGEPNVGKSSLLNLFTGEDTAIVTPIAGTTRDILRAHINLDGLPIKILDTAGLQETHDTIEREGMRRALQALDLAEIVLIVCDASRKKSWEGANELMWLKNFLPGTNFINKKLVIVYNKIDLISKNPEVEIGSDMATVFVSAKSGAGFDLLKNYLKKIIGFSNLDEGNFSARRRHLEALAKTERFLLEAQHMFAHATFAEEIIAENLRLAQQALSQITGEFTSDDLLAKIFAEFCVGK